MRVLLLALLALVATGVRAQYAGQGNRTPEILLRSASIQVNADDSITVTESTRVGPSAPLPFQRDLVLVNRDWSADDVSVLDATENGDHVATRVDDIAGGVRITLIPAGADGTREYTLVYRLGHAVIHLDDNDRLDWPVVSRSSPLELCVAKVKVTLPDGTSLKGMRAWFRRNYFDLLRYPALERVHVRGNEASLYWPDALGVGQTLSVAMTYLPGGAAALPGKAAKASEVAGPPRWVFDGRIWLALLVTYYIVVRLFFTGGVRRKTVIPEYGPPAGYSAAALRLLWHNAYDGRCLAAGILGIAAKGGLRISREAHGSYVATRIGDEMFPGLTVDEHALRSSLFTLAPSVAFTRENAEGLDLVETRFRAVLERHCSRERPASLDILSLPGWMAVLAALGFLYFGDKDPTQLAAQVIAAIAVTGVALYVLTRFVPRGLLRAIRVQAVAAAVICAAALATGVDPVSGMWMAVLLAAQVFAGWWLLRLPPPDTELLRKLRGFRWYLSTAEQPDMDARYKPSLHPELRASFMPYAMALDVEVAWNRQFAGTLRQAADQGFVTELSQQRAGHTEAAVDLLAFARALSRGRSPQA